MEDTTENNKVKEMGLLGVSLPQGDSRKFSFLWNFDLRTLKNDRS